MTWPEFKRKIEETTSRLKNDEVPITFLHGAREVSPTDISVCCEVTGDKLTLIIVLKEGETK